MSSGVSLINASSRPRSPVTTTNSDGIFRIGTYERRSGVQEAGTFGAGSRGVPVHFRGRLKGSETVNGGENSNKSPTITPHASYHGLIDLSVAS